MTPDIFKDLFMLYYNPLCNFAENIVHDTVKSEDIVQEVFMQLWKNRDALDMTGNVKGYLFTATKNKALEELRRMKNFQKNIDVYEILVDRNDSAYDEKEWDEWIKIDRIYSSLRHLPPKCKEVFELAKIKGLSYNQISEIMQISPKTVENHMSKAFMILRTTLLNK